MGEIQTEWLQARKKELGLNDTKIGEAIGRDRSVANRLLTGALPFDMKYLDGLSKVLDQSKEAVLFRFGILDDDPDELVARLGAASAVGGRDGDTVQIQEWDVEYGMGGGSYLDLPVTGQMQEFSDGWLRQFTHSPAHKVFLARGTGDSMMPTILNDDIVLIDTGQREVRIGDKIWAAAYGQTGIIKRLRPMPDGSVKILSDNPNVPPETAYDGELSVVGRVVAIVRKT